MGERRIGGAGERASGEYDADMGSGLGDEMEEEIDINTEDILDAVILSVVQNIEQES